MVHEDIKGQLADREKDIRDYINSLAEEEALFIARIDQIHKSRKEAEYHLKAAVEAYRILDDGKEAQRIPHDEGYTVNASDSTLYGVPNPGPIQNL